MKMVLSLHSLTETGVALNSGCEVDWSCVWFVFEDLRRIGEGKKNLKKDLVV